jgi:hypothetical protein
MNTGTFSPRDANEYSPSIYIFVMGIILTISFEWQLFMTVEIPIASYEQVYWDGGIGV